MTNIKAEITKQLKNEFGIDPSVTEVLFERGLLFIPACRNYLIREEYKKKAQPKERQRVKGIIADSFCVSVKLVEKIVSDKS